MTLISALPLNAFPGSPWSASAPQQTLELITTYDLDELDALSTPPTPDLAWSNVGTMTAIGTGIVKIVHRMPQTMAYTAFKIGGGRVYNTMDAVATGVKVAPADLNFGYPMIWDAIGNGWKLMSAAPDGSMVDFMGINGIAPGFVEAGLHYKCQLLASLYYSSLYCTSLGLTAPLEFTYPQPNNPNGIALFTDGTGAEGSGGAKHYANPTVSNSGRFKNVYPAFGAFATNYGRSLVLMTQKPHPTLPNVTSGARTTDTFGPTHMRERFWNMMTQTLVLQGGSINGTAIGAGVTNAQSALAIAGITEENFLGNAFGPRRFWILPQLDNHPYVQAHLTDGPGGAPADMWINVSAGKGRATYAKLAGASKDFVPTFRFYGPGDPRAESEQMCRFESNLHGGVRAGAPGEADMFFGV